MYCSLARTLNCCIEIYISCNLVVISIVFDDLSFLVKSMYLSGAKAPWQRSRTRHNSNRIDIVPTRRGVIVVESGIYETTNKQVG
jgi:hypothetical protein